jgi:hypothetical protein
MKLALTRRADYPEPIARELEQLIAAITTSVNREHDAEGRQRRIWARFALGRDQSHTTSAATETVLCRVPDSRNEGDLTVDPTAGRVRVPTPGIYTVIGQVRFAVNATGARGVQIIQGENRQAMALHATTGGGVPTLVQVVATVSCVAGDTVAMQAFQNSGGALTMEALSGVLPDTWLSIARVA